MDSGGAGAPIPAALEDAAAAYRWLVEEKGYRPDMIVLARRLGGGRSGAGAGHVPADHRFPLPGRLILMSPWADLTCGGEATTAISSWTRCSGTRGRACSTIPATLGRRTRKTRICPRCTGTFAGFRPCCSGGERGDAAATR